jgi:hypothetical protein
MRVFDCFPFYNEFTLLEIRLEELWDTVDYFVIAEANTTHQSRDKSFYLQDRWSNYEKYHSKIRHIMIDDMPRNPNTWENEGFQRFCLGRGLYDIQPDDIICVSDCDEIPRPSTLEYIRNDPEDYERYLLGMPLFYFKFNNMMTKPVVKQTNIKVTRGRAFVNPHWERTSFNYIPGVKELEHGGWHFTYLGNSNFAVNKIQSFAHIETNISEIIEKINVEKMVQEKVGLGWDQHSEKFEHVKLDSYFPTTILNNQKKYQHLIVNNADLTVYDIYSN